MKTTSITAALILACATWAQAQTQDAAFTWIQFHRVHLRNGNVLEGNLVSRTDQSVTLKQPWGEILIRSDQIDRVEFVKIKSFKDPELLLPKRAKPAPAAPQEISAAAAAVAASVSERIGDSKDPVPSAISALVVGEVDHAIAVWKSSISGERRDLAEELKGFGPRAVPYYEFLLEKRTKTAPLPEVTQAFVALDEERFVTFSKKMMTSPDQNLREAAIGGLASATSPRRLPIMMEAMEDTDPSVWKPAMEGVLAASKQPQYRSDLLDWISGRIPQAKNKTALAVALSRIGGSEARRVLWDLVGDRDETNRLTGLHGLGIIANPDDGERLMSILRDSSEMMRKGACLALGKLKYAPAVADLVDLLALSSPGLSKNARWALTEITGQIVSDTNEAWTEWWQVSGSKSPRYRR
jgi:hypothetical protein